MLPPMATRPLREAVERFAALARERLADTKAAVDLAPDFAPVRDALDSHARALDDVDAARALAAQLDAIAGCLAVARVGDADSRALVRHALAFLLDGLANLLDAPLAPATMPGFGFEPTPEFAERMHGVAGELSRIALACDEAMRQGACDALAGAIDEPRNFVERRLPPPAELRTLGLSGAHASVLQASARDHDRRIEAYYRLGATVAIAVRAGLRPVPAHPGVPFLLPAPTGEAMLQEAQRHLLAAPPRERAALLRDFARQIHRWFGYHWFYYAIPRPEGEACIAGTFGHARWVDADGRLFKGKIRNLYEAHGGSPIDWETLEELASPP